MRQIVIGEDYVVCLAIQVGFKLFLVLHYIATHVESAAAQFRDGQFGVGEAVLDQQQA